jgi:predicted methyltransferase
MRSVPLSPSRKQKELRVIQQIAIANVFIISLIHSLNFYIEHKLQQPTAADPTPQTKIWTTFTYYSPLIQTISSLFKHT